MWLVHLVGVPAQSVGGRDVNRACAETGRLTPHLPYPPPRPVTLHVLPVAHALVTSPSCMWGRTCSGNDTDGSGAYRRMSRSETDRGRGPNDGADSSASVVTPQPDAGRTGVARSGRAPHTTPTACDRRFRVGAAHGGSTRVGPNHHHRCAMVLAHRASVLGRRRDGRTPVVPLLDQSSNV